MVALVLTLSIIIIMMMMMMMMMMLLLFKVKNLFKESWLKENQQWLVMGEKHI